MNPHNIVTDHQLKVSFDDETGSILISTPKGNLIELNDELNILKLSDQFQNSITLNKQGIQLDSYGDITISGMNINLKAQTTIDLNAALGIKSRAMDIEQKADSRFIASGNASAELSASGNTVVKGAIVNIN
ncbi:hypothetical protein [Aquirufa aurantiipilula]|uniref:DUF2345 domain-containing protein n=1 Tax=Aquirufa aurantiipilula TaxID=2696561 RepID=A0ABT6BLJ7_9BACT|nr:hypothetical protein [Aquirufa aurantiipilula]MBZ1325761.1 hypothetical protein [Aquirufa aurantiipilula]MDF5691359.1 hypothetical protein [Aquirufa aurantiipilula]